MKKLFFLCFLLLNLLAEQLIAQCNVTPSPPLSFVNPSFEGPSCAGCQPGPWSNCGGTPDTQPGSWGFTQPASHGNSYVSFLQSGQGAGGYFEGSSQALSSCMTAGQEYKFSIDLAHSTVYNTASPEDCYSSLEIWGSNSLCQQGELLWQSGMITHTNWQTYSVTLTPTSNWCYVSLRPYYISGCSGYVNVMVDNLGAFETNTPEIEATVNSSISCSQDIMGTTSCPADSVVLTGLFNGSPLQATLLTDTTWQTNIIYPLGANPTQKIYIEAFLQTGINVLDSITFNLVDVAPKFSATEVCLGATTSFTDSTTVSSGTIINWLWDFGDGNTGTPTPDPSHTYTTPGTYTVILLVTSSEGCSDTVSKTVIVNGNPTASFNSNNVCLRDTMAFTDSSSVPAPSSITNYVWRWGDNSTNGATQNPSHLYSNEGQHSVTLVTTTNKGCKDSITKSVTVFGIPVSAYTANDKCLSDSILFLNSSTNPPTGTIESWTWNFGDGTPADTINWSTNHLYSAAGTYTVTLITYSSLLGCSDTITDSVTVFPMPNANFNVNEVCQNATTIFTDTSTVTSGAITNWSWTFGDGSPASTIQNPTHIYTNYGVYNVSLTATTNNGCKHSITKNATIHPLPEAAISAANVCNGTPLTFTTNSSIATNATNDSINQWFWNTGDGSPVVATQNTSHTYTTYGSYTATLLVVSSFMCSDSVQKTIVIHPNPTVLFTANDSSGCAPLCIFFQNSSFVPNGTISSWQWTFGDNTANSNSQEATHCYTNTTPSSLLFSPTLMATSDSGCVTSLTKNNYITAYPQPIAQFTVTPQTTLITEPIISIENNSLIATAWSWDFGDGDTNAAQAPQSHTYSDTGTYTITLIASTAYNCKDTARQTVIIDPDFMFYIPNAFSPNGDGTNDFFGGKGDFIKEYKMLIFDRWGNMIYRTDDISKPWDGKSNYGDATSQQDVYVYSIEIVDFKRIKHTYRGTITLVR